MNLRYQLAAIDLDGTLLHGETHALSPGNAAAVRRAAALGVSVVLASGRRYATIAAFARQLSLAEDLPVIAYNGALVRLLNGETWLHQPLPAAAASEIVRDCAAQNWHLNYYLNDELYVRADTDWGRLYQFRTGSVPQSVGDLTQFDGASPTKLLLIDTPAVTDALLLQFQQRYGDALYITKTEDEYLEFMASGVSKGNALAAVADRLHLSPADCVAFGDSYNDLSMLAWAGWGVAMENGRAELKQIADQIAPPADNDGVGVVLDELFPSVNFP